MSRSLFLLYTVFSLCLTACTEKATVTTQPEPLQGIWVREDNLPGRGPADTLTFSTKNGKNILSFYSAGSPGPNWPEHAETEYRFQNGKLSYRNYFGTDNEFFEVESFQWISPQKSFSVKLYQVLRFMSADYRVTYRRVNK
jgi:hypothetical protein